MKKSVRLIIIISLLFTGVAAAADLDDAYEYFMSGQYSKAIGPFERALSSASNKADIYYNLGVCYEKTGNYDRALQNYRNAGSTRDAAAKAEQMGKKIEDRNISSLKREAQSAYDAMNFGEAQKKAQAILDINPSNSWARSFLSKISNQLALPDTSDISDSIPEPDSIATDTAAIVQADTAIEDTLAAEEKTEPLVFPLWLVIIISGVVLIVALVTGFIVGKAGKKVTVEKAMQTLLRMLPAGMISVRKEEKLSLVFFERGKVIKAIVEEADGVKIGGRGVAEEILGSTCEYEEKPEGPWSEFADLMIEVYRHAQVEAAKTKFAPKGEKTPTKKRATRRKKK